MTLNDQHKKAILGRLSTRQFRRRRIRALWCYLTFHDWLHVSIPHDPTDPDTGRMVTLVCFRCADCRVLDVTAHDYARGRWDPQWRKRNRAPR